MPDYLPWDIITTEILSRLPVKSLMRFKCVSKSFYNLISNDLLFKKKHLYHQSSLKKVILVPQYHPLGVEGTFPCCLSSLSPGGDVCEDMTGLELPVRVGELFNMNGHIYHSCDGLFCIGVVGGDVIIWNPSTREAKHFPGCHLKHHIPEYSLAHDSRSDVYKLLGLLKGKFDTCKLCFYSTEMKMWRHVEDCRPPCDFVNYGGNCTIVNGAFHWLGSHEQYFKTPHVVVSLDISDETYGTLAMPQALCNTTKNPILCVLKGKLSVFGQHIFELCRDVWVMKEYGVMDSMTRMFRISCVELPELFCRPLYMLEDDKIIIYREGRTSFYKDGRFLCNMSVGRSKIAVPYVYFESLISPHTLLEKAFSPTTFCPSKSTEIVANNFSATRSRAKRVATWQKLHLQLLCCCKSFCNDKS